MTRILFILFIFIASCAAVDKFDKYVEEHKTIHNENIVYLVSIFSERNSCERIVIYNNNDYDIFTHMDNWADQGHMKGNSALLKIAVENEFISPLKDDPEIYIPQALISYNNDGKTSVHWVDSGALLVQLIRLTSH